MLGIYLFFQHGIPFGQVFGLGAEKGIGGVEDLNFQDFIALGGGVDGVHALGDGAEDAVFAVEPRGGDVGDEELAAVGARAGVGHGEDAGPGVAERLVELVRELIAGAAAAGALRVTALNHEIGDDAVKGQAVVVAAFGEIEEVGGGHGNLGGVDHALDVALVGFHHDADVGEGGRGGRSGRRRHDGGFGLGGRGLLGDEAEGGGEE